MVTRTLPTTDRLICGGCNKTVARRADHFRIRVEAMRMHHHTCQFHGPVLPIVENQAHLCKHSGACFRMVRQDGAAL